MALGHFPYAKSDLKHISDFRLRYFLHYFNRLLQKLQYITELGKIKPQITQIIKGGHYHVELTAVDIYIKLQVTYNGESKLKTALSLTYNFK